MRGKHYYRETAGRGNRRQELELHTCSARQLRLTERTKNIMVFSEARLPQTRTHCMLSMFASTESVGGACDSDSCAVAQARWAAVMVFWFNVRKAAQVAAYFALREGGEINVLKLTKLIYLSDRKFMELYDVSMLLDRLVSMDHGPVNSMTLNYINGYAESGDWDEFIADRAGHQVALSSTDITEGQLDELSDAELAVLADTWGQFGHMDRFALRDHTHDNCPEWDDPHGSSTPIRYAQVFKFLGKRNSAELEERVASDRHIASHFV